MLCDDALGSEHEVVVLPFFPDAGGGFHVLNPDRIMELRVLLPKRYQDRSWRGKPVRWHIMSRRVIISFIVGV